MLAEDIGKKLAKAEEVGAEGNVEESMRLMEEVSNRIFKLKISYFWSVVLRKPWILSFYNGVLS